jgi:hypothetical protein
MRTVLLLASLVAAPLAADCKSAAGNLIAGDNCGFDKDLAGWSAVPEGKVSRDAGENGALRAAGDPSGSLTVQGPCVAVKGGAEVRVGARLKLVSGNAYFCSVLAFEHENASCQDGANPLAAAPGPPSPAWKEIEGSAKTQPATRAIAIRPVCSGEPGFTVLFDDFVVRAN